MAVNATRQELVTDMSWIRTATDLIAGTLAGLTSLVFALTFLFIKEISGYLLSLKLFMLITNTTFVWSSKAKRNI